MIKLIVEQIKEDEMNTSSDVDFNPTGKQRKRKSVKPLVFQMIVFINLKMEKPSLKDGQIIWI